MASVRVLHTSDLHLCSDQSGAAAVSDDWRYGLTPILRVAVDVRADLLLVAGDMFDSPHVPDDLVRSVVRHLRSLPCPVVVLPGNHDRDQEKFLRLFKTISGSQILKGYHLFFFIDTYFITFF